MARHWVLVAHASHAELFEEGVDVSLLLEVFRRSREPLHAFGRRIAREVSSLAVDRSFTDLEIFAEAPLLGPIRLSLDPTCSARLIAASNAVDVPRSTSARDKSGRSR